MSNHCTEDEFETATANGGIFMVGDHNDNGALFYGTIAQWQDCFFDNAVYEEIIDFANDEGMTVRVPMEFKKKG